MADYTELAGIRQESGFGALQDKIRTACVIKAVALLGLSTPTAAQVNWSLDALDNPAGAANAIAWYVIGANESATVAQILTASDSAVQSNVNAAVDKIVSV